MELRVVTTATDIGLASVLKGALQAAGVEAVLSGGSEHIYPGTTLDAVRILVSAADYPRAVQILEQIEDLGVPGEEYEEA